MGLMSEITEAESASADGTNMYAPFQGWSLSAWGVPVPGSRYSY